MIYRLLLTVLVVGMLGLEPADDEEVVLTLEKVTAPFDAKAKVYLEQKDGKLKEYKPAEHKVYEKDVEARELEITELHIKDRKIVKVVFGKKLK